MAQIHQALIAIMREVGSIDKDARNEQQRFDYRSAEQVYNRTHPLFARHGVFSTPKVIDSAMTEGTTKNGSVMYRCKLTVQYTFYAEDGSSVDTVVVGEGMDMADKASNKALTAAHKYAICQILNIPYAIVDPDQFTPEPYRRRVVTLDDLNVLKKAWMAACVQGIDDRSKLAGMFSGFAESATGRKFPFADFRAWTVEDLEACTEAVNRYQQPPAEPVEEEVHGDAWEPPVETTERLAAEPEPFTDAMVRSVLSRIAEAKSLVELQPIGEEIANKSKSIPEASLSELRLAYIAATKRFTQNGGK